MIQGVAFNVTHFESRITHLLYTAINTTEYGYVSQCLGFTAHTSGIANSKWVPLNAARCHSPYGMTLNEHPTCCIPRPTSLSVWCHSVALQFTGPYCIRLFFYGSIWKLKFLLTPSLTLTALKMQFVRGLRMLRRTQQYPDCHGGNLQNVVLKTWGFFWGGGGGESKKQKQLTAFSCFWCGVQ
jgi:hypothetical protein